MSAYGTEEYWQMVGQLRFPDSLLLIMCQGDCNLKGLFMNSYKSSIYKLRNQVMWDIIHLCNNC